MFKKWRDGRTEKLVDKMRAELHRETRLISDAVAQQGYVCHADKEAKVGEFNFKATKIHTVGLWNVGLPELVGYGPIGGLTVEVMHQIVGGYLNHEETPQDGDLVVMNGQRWDMRRVASQQTQIDAVMSAWLYYMEPDSVFTFRGPEGLYQVVPDTTEPPVRHYEAEANSGRTFEFSGKLPGVDIAVMALARKRDLFLSMKAEDSF